jgi:hypothetical protein
MRRNLLPLLLIGLWALPASAQSNYDPYAPQMEDEPPVAEDGTLNWPTFYASAAYQRDYLQKWMNGWCRGTSARIKAEVKANRRDINKMPKGEINGRVLGVGPGMLRVLDAGGQAYTVVTHPAGVSRVSVTGDLPAQALRRGMWVRFQAQVDEHGQGLEELTALDVISVAPNFEFDPVEANRPTTITGRVTEARGNRLQILVDAGSLRRLTFLVSERAVLHVNFHGVALAGRGDRVTATGHRYEQPGKPPVHVLFASDITVEKPELPAVADSRQASLK